MKSKALKSFLTVAFVIFPFTAQAYIGPGMAGSVIATVVGLVAAFFLALFGILYYPIKRAFKNKRKKESEGTVEKSQPTNEPEN